MKAILDFLRDERGTTAIEYALLGGLIAVVIVGSVTTIGTRLNNKFLGPVSGGLT